MSSSKLIERCPKDAIVTRFAPSPTGYLHLGHVRSALEGWQAAREAGGRFLLRIEDIDHARCRDEYAAAILEDLAWLGLDWDGRGPPAIGAFRRLPRRARAARRGGAALSLLLHAARDPGRDRPRRRRAARRDRAALSRAPAATSARRSAPQGAAGGGLRAAARRRGGAGAHRAARLERGRASGSRPQPAALGDVVLARKEMPTSYHLAVTVDDALQGVTLVTRGADLFAATHIHRLLQALLGLPTPRYRHHPLLTDAAGRRLAKRDRALTIRAMREAGMRPPKSSGWLSRAGGEARWRRRDIPGRPAATGRGARRNRGSPD